VNYPPTDLFLAGYEPPRTRARYDTPQVVGRARRRWRVAVPSGAARVAVAGSCVRSREPASGCAS
jgi:hypothetical protein